MHHPFSAVLGFVSNSGAVLRRVSVIGPSPTVCQGYASTYFRTSFLPAYYRRSDSSQQQHCPFHTAIRSPGRSVSTMAVDNVPVLVAPRRGALKIVGGASLGDFTGELLVVGVWGPSETTADPDTTSNGTNFVLPADIAGFDLKILSGALAEAAMDGDFKAKAGSSSETVRVAGARVKRVILYGLGDPTASDSNNVVAKAAAFAVQKGSSIKFCTSVGLAIENLSRGQVASISEGAHVAAYVDERYKEKKTESAKVPSELVIVGVETAGITDVAAAAESGIAVAAGIVTTKEVVSSPANYLNPTTMAIAARQVAEEEGLECKILGRDECSSLGMGALLGVSQGAAIEPQFIHLTYRASGEIRKKIAIVGKTVCHDTGGYNLKAGPGSMIELMKWDMGGGGTTLGAARAIGMCTSCWLLLHLQIMLSGVSDSSLVQILHPPLPQ
jgi:hypothetical protein